MIKRLAHRLGYVPRAQLTDAEGKLRDVRQRLDRATRQIEQMTAASEQFQQARREDAKEYDSRLAAAAADHERRLIQAVDALERKSAKRAMVLEERLRARALETAAALRKSEEIEQQVAASLHGVDIARDSLMAIEVKLDILEGAANVLDRRLRAVAPAAAERL